MKERKKNITGVLIFLVLIIVMIYLVSFSNKAQQHRLIESISCVLLDEKDYLEFARLGTNSDYENLKPAVIKTRLEKHPYAENADVEFINLNNIKVHLREKKIYAVLLDKHEPKFITENFQVLPILPSAKFIDLPVVTNYAGRLKTFKSCRINDIVEAFRIIEAVNLSDRNLSKNLAEINLRNGGDIILNFSGINAPVLFGRGGEAKKIHSLSALWNSIQAANLAAETNYIDLRFSNKIYLGSIQKAGITE
jgi:cell division septal protein FtsQ